MKRCLGQHARDRARERFGIELSHRGYLELCRQIEEQEAMFVERLPEGAARYLVRMPNGQQAIAVWDKEQRFILTLYADSSPRRTGVPTPRPPHPRDVARNVVLSLRRQSRPRTVDVGF